MLLQPSITLLIIYCIFSVMNLFSGCFGLQGLRVRFCNFIAIACWIFHKNKKKIYQLFVSYIQ